VFWQIIGCAYFVPDGSSSPRGCRACFAALLQRNYSDKVAEAIEVSEVIGKQLSNSVCLHSGNNIGIMNILPTYRNPGDEVE
jgi:hypothetical protein